MSSHYGRPGQASILRKGSAKRANRLNRGRLRRYDPQSGKGFCGHFPVNKYAGIIAVLSTCSLNGAPLGWRRLIFLFAASQRGRVYNPRFGTRTSWKALGQVDPIRDGCGRLLDPSERRITAMQIKSIGIDLHGGWSRVALSRASVAGTRARGAVDRSLVSSAR